MQQSWLEVDYLRAMGGSSNIMQTHIQRQWYLKRGTCTTFYTCLLHDGMHGDQLNPHERTVTYHAVLHVQKENRYLQYSSPIVRKTPLQVTRAERRMQITCAENLPTSKKACMLHT